MTKCDRTVRVVSVTEDGCFDVRMPKDELFESMLARLESAWAYHPDIACLPEIFSQRDPEPVHGPVTQRVGAWARERSCYVICPLRTAEDGRVFNSAVLLDRKGDVAGVYHKIRVTENGIRTGESPGEPDPPVFETDFGTIGVQICFDVNWRDAWAQLREKGAEIVFFPAAYPAARLLAAHAWVNEYYVVSSTLMRPSSIYDITGDVLSTSGQFRPWAEATLCLGKRLFEIDYQIEKMWAVEKKYGDRVEVQWFHQEDWVTLASRDPEHLSVADIVQEFGLIPKREYHLRCEAAQEQSRVRATASPGSPDSPSAP